MKTFAEAAIYTLGIKVSKIQHSKIKKLAEAENMSTSHFGRKMVADRIKYETEIKNPALAEKNFLDFQGKTEEETKQPTDTPPEKIKEIPSTP